MAVRTGGIRHVMGLPCSIARLKIALEGPCAVTATGGAVELDENR